MIDILATVSYQKTGFKKRIKKLWAQVDLSKAVMIKARSGTACFEYFVGT